MTLASSHERDVAPLCVLRSEIDRLADASGRYRVACAVTGTTPVPVDGHAFPDRSTAEVAACLAERYRDTLRRWDERTPVYDLIVNEGPAGDRCTERTRPRSCFDADIIRADGGTTDHD